MSGFLKSSPQAGTDAQPEHAERRAIELVEKLQEEDVGRQVAVLQTRIRKQELEGAQLRQEVVSLQAKCRQAEEKVLVTHAEGSAHAEQAKAHASEARALRSELDTMSFKLSEAQSDAAVCESRNAQLTHQLAEARSVEQTRVRELAQQRQELESTASQLNERIVALCTQLADASKERDELRGCTQDLRSTMAMQAKQFEHEMTKGVQERDEQAKKAASAERRAAHAFTELEKTQQSEVKHKQELRRAEGLLRSLNDERTELHYLLQTDNEQHQDMLEREAESRRRVEQESEVAKALVEETMGKVELLQQQHKQAVKSLQAQQACLDEERHTCTKLAKRLERVETARRQETKQLRDEVSALRQAAADAEAGHREAVQQRDVQLVVADSKAAAQRSQIEQQEQELRRMQDQVATRERELATVHEERLNLELKQQQLRYDRRIQELDMENRGRSSDLLQDKQLELFRRVLQEEQGTRSHRSVADEVGRLDSSLREAVSQQFSTVLKEITNRDDTAREVEAKLEEQRQSLRQEADAQLRKQAADSEAAAKASVEAVQAEATAAVKECERKATVERENLIKVRDSLIAENEALQERLDEQGADLYFIQQERKETMKNEERILELVSAKEDLEATLANLRSQLNVEHQAHTQTQQRELEAQKNYQESVVQTQLSKHGLESVKAELKATLAAQHSDGMHIQQLKQQLAAREEQRSQLEEANAHLIEEIGQQQQSISELRIQVESVNSQREELQERIQTIISERIKQHRADMQQEMKGKLDNVSTLVSRKMESFRQLVTMLKTDVRTQLRHVHTDQANTIKRTLERLGMGCPARYDQHLQSAAEVGHNRHGSRSHGADAELVAVDRKLEEAIGREAFAGVDAAQVVLGVKDQKRNDIWNEMLRLRKEVGVLVDERDALLRQVESAESVCHEQHQRLSQVLVILSQTLAIPGSILLRLSEADVNEFKLGLSQVKAELEDWGSRATCEPSDGQTVPGRIGPLLRENDELKDELKRKELQVEQIRAEMQRRCTSFDCQLQSACSECTAAVEEHVTSTLASLKSRVDNAQKDIDRFICQKDVTAWTSALSGKLQQAQDGASKQGVEAAGCDHLLLRPPHDDMEPPCDTACDEHSHSLQASPVLDTLTRSLSVRHDDSVRLPT